MKLSLCMIVKNEEDNLGRCLQSVCGITDEIIIVDTGSTDSTVAIAENFGASVFYFPWNGSFSDARNHSLKQATGDWIMIMDADDELDPAAKQAVRDLLFTDADAYYFETLSFVGDKPGGDVLKNLNLRLMKNNLGFFYSNPIHEQIHCNILAIKPDAKIINLDLKVYHYGYLTKNIEEHNKRARNISLLEKELQDKPGFHFALFNMGSEYYAMGDNLTAIRYFEQAHKEFNPAEGFSSHLLLKMSHCYSSLGRHQDALGIIEEALVHYPQFTDVAFLRGTIYQAQGKTFDAINEYLRCCKMGEAPSILNVIIGAGTFRPRTMIGQLYYNIEDYAGAALQFKLSYEMSPQNKSVLAMLIRCYCKMGLTNSELKQRIAEACADPQDIDLASTVLIQEGYYELALTQLEGREESLAFYQQGLCKIYLKKYDEAYKVLSKLRANAEYREKAICLQALCRFSGGRLDLASKLLRAKNLNDKEPHVIVYRAFIKLFQSDKVDVICEDEAQAASFYTPVIFDILKALLITRQLREFESTLGLLNSITDSTVLLQLAKLYYLENCFELANQELIRSIQTWGVIDQEGARILYKLKQKGL